MKEMKMEGEREREEVCFGDTFIEDKSGFYGSDIVYGTRR